ncbi:MAG: hypothetical protein R3D34_10705 [Nitratireductor sp.]|nr:hypothetical protein [Nitratireductor sp.]
MLWEIRQNDLFIMFAFVCAATFVCGWLADRIMNYSGFGVIGNWMLILIGCIAGSLAYNLAGFRIEWNPMMSVGVAFGAGTFLLLTLASIKAATNT